MMLRQLRVTRFSKVSLLRVRALSSAATNTVTASLGDHESEVSPFADPFFKTTATSLATDAVPEAVVENLEDAPVTFASLGLNKKLSAALKAKGIVTPSPVQEASLPPGLEGQDIIAQARTGTGKTLAFALPMLQRIAESPTRRTGGLPRGVILAPTRELALQVVREMTPLARAQGMKVCAIYGGAPIDKQLRELQGGIDVVVATPGRLLDHVKRGSIRFDDTLSLVLDEADLMLDMGFETEINAVLEALPEQKQCMLFSATLPPWVHRQTSKIFSTKPLHLDLMGKGRDNDRTSETINHVAIACPTEQYRWAALPSILQRFGQGRALIFTETKRDADELAKQLSKSFRCAALHGDISQASRESALQGFREGNYQCLVATDVAARGIDIPQVPLVVQFKPPRSGETYIHRAGRTGRAGQLGTAVIMYEKEHEIRSIARTAGCDFSFVGDLRYMEGSSLQADTVGQKLKTMLGQDTPPAASEKAMQPIVNELCEDWGCSEGQLLAAALHELSKGTQAVPMPSLLTGNSTMCTLKVQIGGMNSQTAQTNIFGLVEEATGMKKQVGRVLEVRSHLEKAKGKQGRSSSPDLFLDVPRKYVDQIIQCASDDTENGLEISRATIVPTTGSSGGKGASGGGKGRKGKGGSGGKGGYSARSGGKGYSNGRTGGKGYGRSDQNSSQGRGNSGYEVRTQDNNKREYVRRPSGQSW